MSVYNGEDYLREAIDSVLAQTITDFEFIIINDGSTDDTLKILRSYSDPRIKIVNQDNHGLVYSLNKGCKLAKGRYLARMDADDISLPSRFEKQLEVFMTQKSVVLVGTFFAYMDIEGNPEGILITTPYLDIDIKRSLYIVNPVAHGSVMMLRSTWKNAGGYTDTYGPTEDYELWSRILDTADVKSYIIPEALYLYRLNPEGISATKQEAQHAYSKKIQDERWSLPYIGKSSADIVRDGKNYHSLQYPYGDELFGTYYSQQFHIMEMLFKRRHFKTGLTHVAALYRLKPDWNRKVLARAVIGGFLRKIGVKK